MKMRDFDKHCASIFNGGNCEGLPEIPLKMYFGNSALWFCRECIKCRASEPHYESYERVG